MNFDEWTKKVLTSVSSFKKFSSHIKTISSLIKDLSTKNELSGDFENFTDEFIDYFSPNLIKIMLSSTPENSDNAQQINSIFAEYLKLLPKYVFSGRERLVNAIYSILTKTEYLFYESTSSSSFSSNASDSKYFKENVKTFSSSDVLQVCIDHYQNKPEFNLENDSQILVLIIKFSKNWSDSLIDDFTEKFGDCFIEFVDKINGKQLRDIREKEIMKVFAVLIEYNPDSSLSEDLNQCRFEYCVRMLKSEYLSKQYSALQTLMQSKTLSRAQIDTIRHEFVIDFLLNHLHEETFHGFIWLFKTLLKLDMISERNIETLWNSCIIQHQSTIDSFFKELPQIVPNLPPDLVDYFWKVIGNSRTMPLAAVNFLAKVAKDVPANSKEIIFNRLFKAAEGQNKEYCDEVNKAIVTFIPTDENRINEIQKKCISFLEENKNVPTSMFCLEKLCNTVKPEEAKKMLSTIVQNAKNLRAISVLLLELIHSILQRYDQEATDDEFKLIKKCLNSALDVAPDKLENFFKLPIIQNNTIITIPMKLSFLQSITKKKTADSAYIHLVFTLFKLINKTEYDSTLSRVKTLANLQGLDALWEFQKYTMSYQVADNLCDIYILSRDKDNMQQFINYVCNHNHEIDPSKVLALERMMQIREGRITGRNQNRWDIEDPRMKVPITGDFTGLLLLPEKITAQSLRKIISGVLGYQQDNISLKLDGKTCMGNISLNQRSLLEVRCLQTTQENPFSVSNLPSHILYKTNLYKKFLPFLRCGNKDTEQRSLNILNMLPTAKEVIDELKTEKPMWNRIFDKQKTSQLDYYLSALGNLALTNYANDFFVNKGAECFFEQLFYDSNFGSNLLVMTITSSIMSSQLGPGAELIRETMLNDLSSEHASFLFEELSQILTINPQSSIKLFDFLLMAAQRKPTIIENKSFHSLLKKAIFHNNIVYRIQIVKLIHSRPIKSSVILPILRLSKTTYCTQYFTLLKECASECTTDDWENILDFLFAQFPKSNDFLEQLESTFPPQQFIDGIIDSLLAFKKEVRTKHMILVKFILDKILFNDVKLYHPSPQLFEFLYQLTETTDRNNDIRKNLLSCLSETHHLYQENCTSINNSSTINSQAKITNSSNPKEEVQKFRGLRNLGATCYMNAALQCLFSIPEFRDRVLSVDCKEDLWFFQLQMLFAEMKYIPDPIIDTSAFAANWKDFDGRPVNVREQQDSLEFIQTVLDRSDDISKGITQIFHGEIVHSIDGISIDYHTEIKEDFTVFPLEIQDKNDVNESFATFLTPDSFTGEDQYRAEGIGKIDAEQHHKIKVQPKILILQLKRFSYDLKTGTRHKIGTKFNFPEILDISKVLSNNGANDQKSLYSLQSVIVHSGTAQSGHYTAYIKKAEKDSIKWYNFNDSKVTEYTGQSIISELSGTANVHYESSWSSGKPSAYVLIYKQVEDKDDLSKNNSYHISPLVLNQLKPILSYSLRHSVLTSEEYCNFFLKVCQDGQLLYEYFTECLINSSGQKILTLLQNKLRELVVANPDFANYILDHHETHFNCLLVSDSKLMRHAYAEVLCASMQTADKVKVDSMIKFLESKFPVIMDYWENFDEFFLPFVQLVSVSGSNELKLLPLFFDFLQNTVPNYAKKVGNKFSYSAINLSSVFKLLVVLLSSPNTRSSYQSVVFSPQFLDPWFQSTHHAVAFSQLLRSFVLDNNDLSSSFFRFFSENAEALSPAAAAGHFSVLIARHNDQTSQQIDWAFEFLCSKSDNYVISFLSSLIEKICESHIDFTQAMLQHANTWCNKWLMSENPFLRKEIKHFTISVFESQNADKRVSLLAEKLLERMPQLASVTQEKKQSWIMSSSKNLYPLEKSLPAPTFYRVLKWTAKKESALSKIADKSRLLVETLLQHKSLQMKDNKPRKALLDIILMIKPQVFFKHVDTKKFLSAFDDLSAEHSLQSALSIIHFADNSSFKVLTQSNVFTQTLDYLMSTTVKESNEFELFIRTKLDETCANSIAIALFSGSHYKQAIKKSDTNHSLDLTLALLREYPQTSNYFLQYSCHSYVANLCKENTREKRYYTLLTEFTDSFRVTNEGRRDWFRRSLIQPLITFWQESPLIDYAVEILSQSQNQEKEANSIASLLISISSCHKSLSAKVLKSLSRFAGKYSTISNVCAQLISIAANSAPEEAVKLLAEELSIAQDHSKSILMRAAARARSVLPPNIAAPLIQK